MRNTSAWRRATLAWLCAAGSVAMMAPLSSVNAQTAPTAAATAAATVTAGSTASAAVAGKAISLPPIEDFFRDAQMRRPVLSPDGRCVAFVVVNTETGRSALAVLELENNNKQTVVASFDDADIATFGWVGNERLVFNSGPDQSGNWRSGYGAGLWSVKRDGTEIRQLIHTRYAEGSRLDSRIVSRALPYEWMIWDVPDDDSGEVLVVSGRFDSRDELTGVTLARLNVEKQQNRIVGANAPENTMDWWLDPVGEPWALETSKGNRQVLYFKTAAGEWTPVQEGELVRSPTAEPFATDGRDLRLVLARTASGTQALYRVDPATLKPEAEPLVSLKGFDFTGRPVYDSQSRRLLGLQFEMDTPSSHWFDPTLKKIQGLLDQTLPGRANVIDCRRCLQTGRMLVASGSDTQPLEFFLYDNNKQKLSKLGAARPWVRAQDMGQREQIRIQARDGLEIPVTVTQPAAKAQGPRPTVVLVHGGPYVRGTQWEWEDLPQFLASRGYVVLEPEFRGSEGYGAKLFQAGWQQWGLAMQDDISDALAWSVKQGWVDAKRVCIAGASYGGYATLMGLIKDPEQYRCGVSWAGVTDIDLLFSIDWSDMSDAWRRYGMVALVGDPKKDAERFRRTSPLARAAELKQPLLLAHGVDDRRVPVEHAWKLRSALKDAGNQDVEYVTYEGERHGWRKLTTKVDFYGRMERFLARHLGGLTSTGATASAQQ